MKNFLNIIKSYFKKYYLVYIIFAILLTVDMITKALAVDINIRVIPNVLSFIYSQNTGGAFSLLSNNTVLLTIITAIFIVVIIVLDKFYKSNSKLYRVGYSLILTGAVGNLIDRILFGYVRDFIKLDFMDFTKLNTIFNVADICVTFGVCIMIIYFIISIVKEKKSEK